MADTSDALSDIDNMSSIDISEDEESLTGVPNIIRHRQLLPDDSESECENNDIDNVQNFIVSDDYNEWFAPVGATAKVTSFISSSGVKSGTKEMLLQGRPQEFYQLFVTDDIFEKIAIETNRYADQVIEKITQRISFRSHSWSPTNKLEIKRFFGLIIWMGLVKLPSIYLYWSKEIHFRQTFPQSIMSRNRFQILLQMIHFADNTTANPEDRLAKIHNIVNDLNINYKKCYEPQEYVCVDESMIPFRGRISFRQYMKSKRHRYGLKIFKLCTGSGYTYSLEVYCGKNMQVSGSMPSHVVMNLMNPLLWKGHTVCTDNWYTSLDLANKLLATQTHLVGTIRIDRKGLPKEVTSQKLYRGEIAAKQNKNCITILKWKDTRDVTMLSTKHNIEYETVKNRRGREIEKPKMIVDYNRAKAAVDLSDQMSSYCSPLRKTIKWYRKLAFELLLNTSIVNALVIFKEVKKEKITIVEFRKELVFYLTSCKDVVEPSISTASSIIARRSRHELLKKDGSSRNVRRCCTRCYKLNGNIGRQFARNKTKQVVTYCGGCDGFPHLCLACFNIVHRNI